MIETASRCIVCSAPTRLEGWQHDDRYGYPGRYGRVHCVACGHRSLQAAMTAEEITDLYTRYYPRSSFDVEAWSPPREEPALKSWWRGSKSSAFRWVPRDVRVLDIGCGFAESLGYHKARGCDAQGVEADRNVQRVAERYGLDVKVGLFDASNHTPDGFDVVTLDQVIEHVADPATVLAGVHRVLKPGGTLVITTPNADGWGARLFGGRWVHWHAPYHLQFFSPDSMKRSAAAAGLRLERRATVTNSAWLDYQWSHLATFPAAGRPSPFWSAGAARSVAQRIVLKLLRAVDRLGINGLFTRIADALGRGDNTVYILRKQPA